MEFQSVIVNLTSAMLNAPSANGSDSQVSNLDAPFGAEKNIRKEDTND
jgi:hypothetical protein